MSTSEPSDITRVDAATKAVASEIPLPVDVVYDMGGTFAAQIDLGSRGFDDDPHDRASIDPDDPELRWYFDVDGGRKTIASDLTIDSPSAAVASWVTERAREHRSPAATKLTPPASAPRRGPRM